MVIAVGHSPDGTVSFFNDDGSLAGTRTFSASNAPDMSGFATAAGRFWYISKGDHHLHSVTPNGSDTDIAPLQDLSTSPYGLAVSPDGRQWAWGVWLGTSAPYRVRVDLGGVGMDTRYAMEESTSNSVLEPLAWTSAGLVVERQATGIGGCCYLIPETGAKDAMLLDPGSLRTVDTWPGCATASASDAGSLVCIPTTPGTPALVVHRQQRSDVTLQAQAPVRRVGWAIVDDARGRALFGVVHSDGAGGSSGPYSIDTEAGDLGTGQVATIAGAVTPNAVLPDGRLVVTSAPPVLSPSGFLVSIRSTSGQMQQLGSDNSYWIGDFAASG